MKYQSETYAEKTNNRLRALDEQLKSFITYKDLKHCVKEAELRLDGRLRDVVDKIEVLFSKFTFASAEIDRIFSAQAVTVSCNLHIHHL